ncbi:hypothetical protein [Cellulomonas denverensis]|uniref:Uncharacterized protein n=1 Tax=Cellulomonas denverensis TaxID=264297 RepID=A0A7X6KTI1_9CELL|nr:hypothetical protein [Cellulomonas denverensis]NKY21858.1 hypothetical protein [Cellulomonas denverensis]GIG24253.1 hypothetical protein Cde04nite_04970 [Cellulomonas denverensis]
MRRLVWIGVGAVAAVAVAHRLGLIEVPGTTRRPDPVVAAARGLFAAGRTAGGVGQALRQARTDFRTGMAEREAELRDGLLGEADIDAIKAERAARTQSARPDGVTPPAWHTDPEARREARAARARRGWEDAPTEDPEDDGDLPYSFF